MYYHDPDGNQIEIQVGDFDTTKTRAGLWWDLFSRKIPLELIFTPEELIRRVESGESHANIKKRVENGPRGMESIPLVKSQG